MRALVAELTAALGDRQDAVPGEVRAVSNPPASVKKLRADEVPPGVRARWFFTEDAADRYVAAWSAGTRFRFEWATREQMPLAARGYEWAVVDVPPPTRCLSCGHVTSRPDSCNRCMAELAPP